MIYTQPRLWSALLLALVLLTTLSTHADSITVKKIKGNQAVVEMSSPLEIGKTYNLESENLTLSTDFSSQFKSRLNSISLGYNFNFLSANKTQDSTFAFFGRYGWNHSIFEFGPVIQVEIYDKGFGTNTTYLVGGYFDYNYGENKSPRDLVYGPTAQISLGNRNFESGGSAQLSQIQVAGFLTWFINRSPVALRIEVGYQTRRISAANDETTLSGAASQLYMMYYY